MISSNVIISAPIKIISPKKISASNCLRQILANPFEFV